MKIDEIIREIREGKRAIENDDAESLEQAVKIVWPKDIITPSCKINYCYQHQNDKNEWDSAKCWKGDFTKATYFIKLWHEQKSEKEFKLDKMIKEICEYSETLGLKATVNFEKI